MTSHRVLLAICAFAVISPAFAAEQVDEVIVSGRLSELRYALADVENRFHSRYNEINKDPQYDIQCEDTAPTGTLLRKHRCEPKFAADIEQEEVTRMLQMTAAGGTYVSFAHATIQARMPDLKLHMTTLVKGDPQLQQMLVERHQLQQRYHEVCKRIFGKYSKLGSCQIGMDY